MVLHEVGILLDPISQVIQETGLQTAEAIVQTRDMRFRELIGMRIPLSCQFIDDRTAGIA